MKRLPYPVRNSGQALLIVLLSMAVVLTIVLSILSRSVTDITVTTKEEEALRAFSAAEAGVENALIVGTGVSGTLSNQSSFSVTISAISDNSPTYSAPDEILSGESLTVWFMEHDPETGSLTCSGGRCFIGSQMKVCWGEAATPANQSTTPAIEISVLYDSTPGGNFSDVKIGRVAFDPYTSRSPGNSFSSATSGCPGIADKTYAFSGTVDFASLGIASSCYNQQACLLSARIRMFYNPTPHPIGFDVTGSGSLLPSQGKRIESVGTFGDSTRKVEVHQTFGELPPIFDSAIYTPFDITK